MSIHLDLWHVLAPASRLTKLMRRYPNIFGAKFAIAVTSCFPTVRTIFVGYFAPLDVSLALPVYQSVLVHLIDGS
jgi:hypothetical protein